MSRFRMVDVRVWNDSKFRALSDDGKMLFLLILTHPNLTSLGAMRAMPATLAWDLRWPEARAEAAFQQVLLAGLIEFDEGAQFLGLPNFLRYNKPRNENAVIGWTNALDLLPECDLRTGLISRADEYLRTKKPQFYAAWTQALGQRGSESPSDDAPAPKKKAKAAKPPADPAYRQFTDYFCERWAKAHPQALNGYPWNGGKDGVAAAKVWRHVKEKLADAKQVVDAYFACPEAFYNGDGTVSQMAMHLAKFSGGKVRARQGGYVPAGTQAGIDYSAGETRFDAPAGEGAK